jgi:hypothetical protein
MLFVKIIDDRLEQGIRSFGKRRYLGDVWMPGKCLDPANFNQYTMVYESVFTKYGSQLRSFSRVASVYW